MNNGISWTLKYFMSRVGGLSKPHIYYDNQCRKWTFIKSRFLIRNLEARKLVDKLNSKGD